MSTQTFKIINGIVSFSVFAMVAVAVIASQARATGESARNDFRSARTVEGPAATVNTRLLLGDGDLRYLEFMPVIVNSMLDLPVRVDVDAETRAIRVIRKPVPAGEQ